MITIIPCCDYVCYQNGVPRFLTVHNGISLLERILESHNEDEVIVPIYKSHYEMMPAKLKQSDKFQVCLFERKFRSQSETIYATINKCGIENQSIFIKDSDSMFDFQIIDNHYGYICVESLNNFIRINVNNKSYVVVDHNYSILNIREGMVISDLFNTGGYYFPSAKEFCKHFEKLNSEIPPWNNQIHLSDIIGSMILDNEMFEAKQVSNYKDYGTKEDYEANIRDQ